MRLEHVLSEARIDGCQMPVRQAAALIEAARVAVAGVIVVEPSHQVLLGGEDIHLDGVLVDTSSIFHSLLLFHKPPGTVCEAQHLSERSIFCCLTAKQQHPGLTFFGRLDRDTTGLMLLGTDGGLGHLLTNPECHVAKEYWALLTGVVPLTANACEAVAAGLHLADGTVCRPATMDLEEHAPGGAWDSAGPACVLRRAEAANRRRPGHPAAARASGTRPGRQPLSTAPVEPPPSVPREQPCVRLTLHEGCNHQVKRMLGACNGNVVGLHREALGPLRLSELNIPCGTARAPSAEELQLIRSLLPQSHRVGAKAKRPPPAVRPPTMPPLQYPMLPLLSLSINRDHSLTANIRLDGALFHAQCHPADEEAAAAPRPPRGPPRRSIDFLLSGSSVGTNRHLARLASAPYLKELVADPWCCGLLNIAGKRLRKELTESFAIVEALEEALGVRGASAAAGGASAAAGGAGDALGVRGARTPSLIVDLCCGKGLLSMILSFEWPTCETL